LWFIRRRNKFFKSFTGWFIGSDSTREIKRPFAARDQTIEEAIKAKKISSCTIDPTEYTGESDKIINYIETYECLYVSSARPVTYDKAESVLFCRLHKKRFEIWSSPKR
jgi:hypothetical protein